MSSPLYTIHFVGLQPQVGAFVYIHPLLPRYVPRPIIPTVEVCLDETPASGGVTPMDSCIARAQLAAVRPLRHYAHGETSENFEEEGRWAGDKRRRTIAGITCLPDEVLQTLPSTFKIRTADSKDEAKPKKIARRRVFDRFKMKVRQIVADRQQRRQYLEPHAPCCVPTPVSIKSEEISMVWAGESDEEVTEMQTEAKALPADNFDFSFSFSNVIPAFLVTKGRPTKFQHRRIKRVKQAISKQGPAWGAVFRRTYKPVSKGKISPAIAAAGSSSTPSSSH